VLGAALGGLALAAMMPQIGAAASLGRAEVQAIAFEGRTPVFADGGLRRAQGQMASWRPVSAEFGDVTALAAHPDGNGRIFAGTRSGRVLVSEDGGASWTESGSGLPGAPVTALAVAAGDPRRLYVAIEGDGLWTSADAGESWEFAMDRPFIDGAERDLLTLASVNAKTGMGGIWIYAGTEAGLTRLPDCFCRWQDVQPGNAMDALVAGEAAPEVKPLPEGEPVLSLAVAPQDGSVIYAALPSGTWKSTDAGVKWARMDQSPARLVAVNSAIPAHVVAITEAGVLTSRDGGMTWTAPGA
jgi:photosystem II stability/assembly factor-like uncharacterized protein